MGRIRALPEGFFSARVKANELEFRGPQDTLVNLHKSLKIMKIPTFSIFSILASALILPLASAGEMKSSRLIAPEELEQWVQSFSSKLAISDRDIDPFGQVQQPMAKRFRPAPAPHAGARVHAQPFAQLVERIPIAAVAPAQKRAMIAGKFFDAGEGFPVRIKGREVHVEIIEVAADAVSFRNTETGEVVKKALENRAPLLRKQHLRKDFEPQPGIDLN